MARRTRTAPVDDGDSLKENVVNAQGNRVKVERGNARKGKAQRVESDEDEDEEQIPSQPNGAEEDVADQDGEGEQLEEVGDDEVEGTPRGRKRVRVNSVGASVLSSPNRVQRERVQTLPRDNDG